jgi:hypothetical protein
MNKTRIQHFDVEEGGQQLLSHYRVVTNNQGRDIGVPVVDVRDGISYRIMAYGMVKANSRSKYMNYTEYNRSHKKQTNI